MQTVRETLNDGHLPEGAQQKSSLALVLVTVALALTVASVVFFKVANASLERSMGRLDQEISDMDASIAKLEGDHDIRAYKYYKNAREEVEKSIRLSMAQIYITEFIRLSEKYGVDLTGFSFADGKISTSAKSEDRGEVRYDAVEKISEMIADYRTNKDESLFLLNPVMSVEGDENLRNFGVGFQIDEAAVLKSLESASGATTGRRMIQEASGSLAPAAPDMPSDSLRSSGSTSR